MKKQYLAIILLLAGSLARGLAAADELTAVRTCLANWGEYPFSTAQPQYRVIGTHVKVFGIGNDVNDQGKTAGPDLVLIKPNVSVMGKARMNLMNPNGWYCLDNKVNVMSKTIINIDCAAHIASASEGVTVLGSNEKEDGVTVMGKAVINRLNCR